jgi:hypothetical protein
MCGAFHATVHAFLAVYDNLALVYMFKSGLVAPCL